MLKFLWNREFGWEEATFGPSGSKPQRMRGWGYGITSPPLFRCSGIHKSMEVTSIKVVLVFPLSSGLPIVCGGVGFTSLQKKGKLLVVIPEWCSTKCQNIRQGNKAQGIVSSKWFTDRSQKQRFALPNYSLISLIKLLSLDVIQNSKSTLQKSQTWNPPFA